MTGTRPRILIFTVMVLLACAIPGLPTAQPVQVVDERLLATMVAGTAAALFTQTAEALPNPTASPAAPTASPTAQVSGSGSSLAKLANGSSLFVDERAGYELIVPAGWLAVRINEQEYFDAFLLPENSDPAIQRSLNSFRGQDPNRFRLFALDTQSGHIQGGFVTNISALWDEQDEMSFTSDEDLQTQAEALSDSVLNLEVLSVEVQVTPKGLQMGVITAKWPAVTVDGANIVIFSKQAYFKVKVGTLAVTLTTTEGLRDSVLPALDAMIEDVTISLQ